MNVILLERVGKLGNVGDVANVKAGYARNFLFPTGIAIPATKENLGDFEQRRSELMAAHNEKLAAAQARAAKVNGLTITIEVNAGDAGRLFGSVGTKDISEALNAAGADTVKSEVQLPIGAIRTTGSYEISLDLGYDVQAVATVNIVPQAGVAPPMVDTETGEDLVPASEDNAGDDGDADSEATSE